MRAAKWVLSFVLLTIFAFILATPPANVMQAQEVGPQVLRERGPNEKGGEAISGPYDYVKNWPQPIHSDGWSWGSIPAVFAESPDRVYVFMRGEKPEPPPVKAEEGKNDVLRQQTALIRQVMDQATQETRREHFLMIFDRNGKLVDSWEQHNDIMPGAHRVRISPYDPDKHVWLIGGNRVAKFTNDGKKLVMTLDLNNVPGNEPDRFLPADIYFLPNGDFYAFGGPRINRFSKDGKYLSGWGKAGDGPNEFSWIHSLVMDAKRRIYVGDRNNSRIQVLDENGKFIEQWYVPYAFYLYMSKDQYLWAVDGLDHKIYKFDLNGKLLYSWGTFGKSPGYMWGPHQISVDTEGNLYVGNAQGNNVMKLRPKKGADPAHLIGPEYVLPASSSRR